MNGNFVKTKKVLAVLIGAFMLIQCAAVAVSAAETDPAAEVYVRPFVTELECEQIGSNYVYASVTTENSDNDQPITVYFVDGAGRLCSLASSAMRDNSAYIRIGVPDSVPTGSYDIVIALSKAGETTKTEFFYVGVDDVAGLFEAINSADADSDEVYATIDAHSAALSVIRYSASGSGKKVMLSGETYKNLTEAQKKTFAELILSGVNGKFSGQKGSFNPENSEQFVKEALVLAIYNSAEGISSEDLINSLYKYDSTVGFNSEESLYARIEKRDTLGDVIKNMLPEANSVEELSVAIKSAAGVELVNETHWADVVNTISEQNEIFGVDEDQIEKLQNNKTLRNAFCESFRKLYYSVDEIRESWDSTYKATVKTASSGRETSGSSKDTSKGVASTVAVGTSLINANDTLGVKKSITDYYTDMGDYAWAADYILDLTEAGVISGYGDKTFGPANRLTRAEFMKMLINACGLADITATSTFTDVDKDAWYYVYIASAEKLGLATGYGNGLFGVNDTITREDMVTLIYRAARIKNLPIQRYGIGTLPFEDGNQISSYAQEAAKALYGAGIYLDTSDNSKLTTFEPKSYASRAYAAVVLDQIYNLKK